MTATYQLDPVTWDLVIGPDGNYATVTGPAQIAQDVASAVRTFARECWYDTTQGLPYFASILGKLPAQSFLKAQITTACLTVPTVTAVAFNALTIANRKLTGQILVSTTQSAVPIEVTI
jgi:hypothetical protein